MISRGNSTQRGQGKKTGENAVKTGSLAAQTVASGGLRQGMTASSGGGAGGVDSQFGLVRQGGRLTDQAPKRA